MESVFEALKAMEKASVIEIAARTGIDRDEVVNHLWDLKRHGRADRHGRAWSVIDLAPANQAKGESADAVIKPADPSVVLSLLKKNGPMNTEKLTELYGQQLGRNFREMFSALNSMAKRGVLAKNGDGELITWSIHEPEPAPAEKTTAEIVEVIPAFTARPDGLVIPSARFISSEIRRTKAKLASLQKLQGAVRELRRHKNLLVGLKND